MHENLSIGGKLCFCKLFSLFSLSGHEDALSDFGIYEFVAFPDASGVPRVGFPSG